MDIKQDFKVYCSTNFKELKKSLIESKTEAISDDELYIEGIASTTSIDEDGDYMTKSCLEDMKRQVLGLSILKEHGRTLDDIIGRVTQVLDSNADSFKIKSKILPKFKYYLLDLLENDINLGYSIGAKAIDYEPNENSEYGWKINKVKLYEISLVPLPANWDSFGSVKISKELDNDGIVAKCFNGACKQLVKQHSENINKELEDAQNDGEEHYVTKKECINLINELGLGMYERLLSEVLDETKRMIEKYHLDNGEKSKDSNNESENSNNELNVDENSSNEKGDKEKNKDMTSEEKKDINVEETPDVVKELEESKGTSEMSGEVNEEMKIKEIGDATIEAHVSVDEVSNTDVLKSIDDMKSFFEKKFNEDLDSKLDEKLEKMKNNLREEIEEELFKDLTTERQPTETKQPKVEEVIEENNEEESVVEEVNKAMSTRDIAKMLTR